MTRRQTLRPRFLTQTSFVRALLDLRARTRFAAGRLFDLEAVTELRERVGAAPAEN
jgi:hypothetical protein